MDKTAFITSYSHANDVKIKIKNNTQNYNFNYASVLHKSVEGTPSTIRVNGL